MDKGQLIPRVCMWGLGNKELIKRLLNIHYQKIVFIRNCKEALEIIYTEENVYEKYVGVCDDQWACAICTADMFSFHLCVCVIRNIIPTSVQTDKCKSQRCRHRATILFKWKWEYSII